MLEGGREDIWFGWGRVITAALGLSSCLAAAGGGGG